VYSFVGLASMTGVGLGAAGTGRGPPGGTRPDHGLAA